MWKQIFYFFLFSMWASRGPSTDQLPLLLLLPDCLMCKYFLIFLGFFPNCVFELFRYHLSIKMRTGFILLRTHQIPYLFHTFLILKNVKLHTKICIWYAYGKHCALNRVTKWKYRNTSGILGNTFDFNIKFQSISAKFR